MYKSVIKNSMRERIIGEILRREQTDHSKWH
jgi:hypothetical protein